jgi:hypothetical protein
MMHWKASRLLASLPDGTLPRNLELDVRDHVASCARCRQRLKGLELSERLFRGMPSSVSPLEWSPRSYRRLTVLARWSNEPEMPGPERWRIPILSLASALAIVTMAVMMGRYSPVYEQMAGPTSLIYTQPDGFYVPSHWR